MRGTIGAIIDTAINSGRIGDSLVASLHTAAVRDVVAVTQGAVGDLTDGMGANDLPVMNMVAHALIGGLASDASGGKFAEGAASGLASAAVAQWPGPLIRDHV